MQSDLTRRRFVAISAAAGGCCLVPFGTSAYAGAPPLVEWNGVTLGASASIRLTHPDRSVAGSLLRRAVAESRRLESIFSLYREDTALAELNRTGVLAAPPPELVDLLGLCARLWRDTGGVFDPTVQPLWRCYSDHFANPGADASGPGPRALADALRLVGLPKVIVSRDRIVFEKRGMALTLNGVAQGYITDLIVDLLRQEGVENTLVDMGEIRSLGRHPSERPWQTALQGALRKTPLHTLDLVDRAVATSAAVGFQFTPDGRCNHLFNPANGRCADPARSLSVIAPTAAAADGLSTAFTLMGRTAITRTLAEVPNTQVYFLT